MADPADKDFPEYTESVLDRFLILILALHSSVLIALAEPSITRNQKVYLNAGDLLSITSNRTSIQKVLVAGNVSAQILQKPEEYPANSFAIGSAGPGTYVRAYSSTILVTTRSISSSNLQMPMQQLTIRHTLVRAGPWN